MAAEEAVPRIEGEVIRSYRTSFPRDEAPISEGGIWLNGAADGVDWADVLIRHGTAIGDVIPVVAPERRAEQGNVDAASTGKIPEGDYNDPTALLRGPWGRNQHGRARVFSRNQTDKYFQEVEIRLRSWLEPHRCTGYEVFFRCLKTAGAYAEIVRWNGGVGKFTSLARQSGRAFGVEDGDVIEATAIGSTITGYINGVAVISVVDGTFQEGSPGIGFNFGVGETNIDHGLTFFEVETYEP
jgi:hypothetical protein